MLKLLAVVTLGGAAGLLGSGVILGREQGRDTWVGSQQNPEGASQEPESYVKVKVKYFQMASTLPGIKEETVTLESPAHYNQLLATVIGEHPALAGMLPNMMVLVDGLVANPNTSLNDGDEVDFIPATSGG